MGLEMDMRKRLNATTEIPSFNPDSNYNDELEAGLMKYTNDSKVDKPLTEQTKEACWNDSGEVDILDCTKSGANVLVEVQHQDTTESSSSSFGNSDSDDDNLGDEAISSLQGDAESALDFHCDRPRKKKLTPHWKAFIQPVIWRCKWAELQITKLEAQARKYERQLAKYNQQKNIQLESSAPENITVKSLPFPQLNLRNKLLRRKKRRKTETTTDLAAHMSKHNLFSYYENMKSIKKAVGKAKKPAKAVQKDKVVENFKIDESLWASDGLLWAKPGDDDYPTEQMLQKIMSLESRVEKMRGRVGKVITENSGKFSYLENLSLLMPNNTALIESPQYDTAFEGANVGSYSSSQYKTEPYVGDAFMTGIASTSHSQEVPDSTQNENLSFFADLLKNGQDGVLAANLRVKQEINDFDATRNWPMQRPLVIKDEPGSSSTALMEEPDLPFEDEPPRKTRSIAKLTAPAKGNGRGRRKGAGRGPEDST